MSRQNRDISQFSFSTPVYVRWSDLDELAHVNNAVFLSYLEESRIGYLEGACKWNWKKDGIIVAHIGIDYLAPLLYPNPTKCYVRCSKIGGSSFELEYIITMRHNENEVQVAAAKTIMVTYDYATASPRKISAEMKEKFLKFEKTKPITD